MEVEHTEMTLEIMLSIVTDARFRKHHTSPRGFKLSRQLSALQIQKKHMAIKYFRGNYATR